MNLSPEVLEKAREWAFSPTFDENTQKEVRDFLEKGEAQELQERFYKELHFGTGGMRGLMGSGTQRVNLYTIRKASLALGLYLKKIWKSPWKVAVSYDSRRDSQNFARAACEVLAACEIQTYITPKLRPVPFLSFMVRHYECHGGICITASHNPPSYNGFKVYWRGGGQLVPPHDKEIINIYNSLDSYDISFIPWEEAKTQKWIYETPESLDDAYIKQLQQLSLYEGAKNLKIIYTPLHGSGITLVPKALKAFGFEDVHLVSSQKEPDGDFPTVFSPNPEELSSLEEAKKLGETLGGDLVLGTDPDADRVGMLVKENGSWARFNGNQIGSLLLEYLLSQKHRKKTLPQKGGCILKTVVTTDLQKAIGTNYGVETLETLTGFKWIGALVEKWAQSGEKTFLWGGEESYGFLTGNFVRDKDGVMGCALLAEMVAYYKSRGETLDTILDSLFQRHGVYLEELITISIPGQEGQKRMVDFMTYLRTNPSLLFPLGEKDPIKQQEDYLKGEKFPPTDMIIFRFHSGTKLALRPSGTEPKMKFYLSVHEPVEKQNIEKAKSQAKARLLETQKSMENWLTSLGIGSFGCASS